LRFHLHNEQAFLREVLRKAPAAGALGHSLREGGRFDWDYFETILFATRVVPTVAGALRSNEGLRGLFPPPLLKRVLEEGEKNIARALMKEKEIGEVLPALAGEGIPCILLKGLPFGERYFGDGANREVRDLDLLVPPEKLRAAEAVLGDLGYSLFEGVFSRSHYRRHHFHVVYARRDQSVDVVELHWNLLYQPESLGLDVNSLFQNSRPGEYGGVPIRLLSPLDEIICFCASLRMSQFTSLKRLLDLYRLLEGGGAEYGRDALLEKGGEWGLRREVAISLGLLERFWGDGDSAGEPREVRRFLSPYRPADFFGVGQGREILLRLWSGFHLGHRSHLRFLYRLLVPDESFLATMYYCDEGRTRWRRRLRRFFAGFWSLLQLMLHWAIAGLREIR